MTTVPKQRARKATAYIIAIGFVFALYSPLAAPHAEAQIGAVTAFEVNPVIVAGALATVAAQAPAPTTPRDIVSTLLILTAKTAIDSITQSIVSWINSGFSGSPAFATDLKRNLSYLADAVAEDFISGLDQVLVSNTGFSVRAPFQDQVVGALRREVLITGSTYGFDERFPFRDCYSGRGFTLDGFHCQSQNPANSAFGRYELARNELFTRLNQETQNLLRELDWGRGFLSWRGPCGPHGRPSTADAKTTSKSLDPKDQKTSKSLHQKDQTVGCSIRTPGAVIEEQLAQTLGTGVRQLELADNFNEIVSALIGQLLNQVLGGGGLAGISEPAYGGGPSYADRLGDPSQYDDNFISMADLVQQNIRVEEQRVASYQQSWSTVREAAVRAASACSGADRARAEQVAASAEANLSRASAAVAAIREVQGHVNTARNSPSPTAISEAVARWNSLLGGSVLPTPQEQTDAQLASADTGASVPGSLYSQMVRLENSCRP